MRIQNTELGLHQQENTDGVEWEYTVLEALSELYKPLLSANTSLESMSSIVLASAKTLTKSAHGFAAIIDPVNADMVVQSMTDMLPGQHGPVVLPRGEDGTYSGLWGHALNTHKAFYTNSYATYRTAAGLPEGHVSIQRFLAVPVLLGDQLLGQIALANSPHDYTSRDLSAVYQIAELYALAIRNKWAELEREQMISGLDAFAHIVAHDLKNPLGVTLGVLDMLDEELNAEASPRLKQCLEIGMQAASRMNSIVDSLLLLATVRGQNMPITPTDMRPIIEQTLQDLSYTITDYEAEVHVGSDWPCVLGYGPWIEHVWVNYITNAIKYGGTPPVVELGAERLDNGFVRFWVRDNGLGIPPEDQQALFKPFTRRSRHTDGYGLGLSIVQRIVEKLGGHVSLESEMGQGSVFSFTLMAAP